MSHDLLDDLVVDVPRHVVADPDRAWRAGTGRRRRRYAAEGLAVAAAVVLVGLALVQLHDRTPVQPVKPGGQVDGYPREVPRPFFEPALPKAPGAVAGVFMSDRAWHVVGSRGETWRLDADADWTPVLSNDGTQLARLRSDGDRAGHVEVLDLLTGSVRSYPDVGVGVHGSTATRQEFTASRPGGGFWSPDGTRLLLMSGAKVLVLENGSVSMVELQGRPVKLHGPLAGWTSATTFASLSYDDSVVVTGLDGTTVRTVPLAAKPKPMFVLGTQVSPDGTKLAVVDQRGDQEITSLRIFSLATGEELPGPTVDPEAGDPGQPVWRGDDVLCWSGWDLVDPTDGSRVVRLSHRWSPWNIVWAPGSLNGPGHDGPSPLGYRYGPLWWWWKQILGGAVALVVILGIWWLDRRDRKKLRRAT